MRVAILFNAVGENASLDELDVLIQADAIEAALGRLGHETERVPCTLDLASLARELDRIRPDAAFNLVESLEGNGRLIHLVPAFLDARGVPYTGNPTEALFITSHKVLAKERMRAAGLPTPDWLGPWPDGWMTYLAEGSADGCGKPAYIVKSVWEHASFGLDDGMIVPGGDAARLARELRERAPRLRGSCFAEEFVDGREFNISIIAGEDGPRVLPHAEILFNDFPEGKPKIVGYQAKWEEDSAAYMGTPRTFEFAPEDSPLLEAIGKLSRAAWGLFGLRGYARVDFRVDGAGRPFILEVNANPCLSPDSGFVAAADRGGYTFDGAIAAILADAARGGRG